ncbi:hypothetical protein AVEN_9639-1 [Araneus ventricosus]|uniref:Uncharacterized protein n=1 Tax=Araneus ventricosus TaxID=182803 RepID=A0A4Y2EX45_ARAVE|nr:hypothetical protein AVEN_9639-1 [Araneus ventricosus]
MSTLPSEFFEFKSIWESIAIEERSVNKLRERLRLIELRLPSKTGSTALVATKKKLQKKWIKNPMCVENQATLQKTARRRTSSRRLLVMLSCALWKASQKNNNGYPTVGHLSV